MSDTFTIGKGQSRGFTTRATGLKTTLFLQGGTDGSSKATWHIEMCCYSDNDVNMLQGQPLTVDISSAAGALVTVRNTGFVDFKAWTDY